MVYIIREEIRHVFWIGCVLCRYAQFLSFEGLKENEASEYS